MKKIIFSLIMMSALSVANMQAQTIGQNARALGHQISDSIKVKTPVVIDSIRTKTPVILDSIGTKTVRVGERVVGYTKENANKDSIRSKSIRVGNKAVVLGDSAVQKSRRLLKRLEQQ